VARQSKIQNRKAATTVFVALAVCLVAAGAIQVDHHYLLAGTQLIGWAFLPLAIALGFTWPVKCRVKTSGHRACRNWAYGFLFGCSQAAGHRWGKLLVRLGLKGDEARPVESRKAAGSYALAYQPPPQSTPNPPQSKRTTNEDSTLSKCGAWFGIASAIATFVQTVITLILFVH
jgi:hypothetical protein